MQEVSSKKWDVFLSHAMQDAHLANALANNLTLLELRVWLDKNELRPGNNLSKKVKDAIRESWFFVPLVTRDYLARDNESWIGKELELARVSHAEDDRLIPVRYKVTNDEVENSALGLDAELAVDCVDPAHAAIEVYQAMFPGTPASYSRDVSTSVRLDRLEPGESIPRSLRLEGAASVVIDAIQHLFPRWCQSLHQPLLSTDTTVAILRELLVNAIAHRDYRKRGDIIVEVGSEHMAVLSPGLPPEPIGIDRLLESSEIVARNPFIVRVLKGQQLMELSGTGLQRVCQQLRDADLPPPKIRDESGKLCVRIALGRDPQAVWPLPLQRS